MPKGGEHVAQADNPVSHYRSFRHYYSCTYYVWVPSWGGRHVGAAYLRARSRDPFKKGSRLFLFLSPRPERQSKKSQTSRNREKRRRIHHETGKKGNESDMAAAANRIVLPGTGMEVFPVELSRCGRHYSVRCPLARTLRGIPLRSAISSCGSGQRPSSV